MGLPKPKWEPAHITTMLAFIPIFRDAQPQDRDGVVEETRANMQHIECASMSDLNEEDQKIVSTDYERDVMLIQYVAGNTSVAGQSC